MPHHQSFAAAQSSSIGPSGRFSTPFQNIPGPNVPTTAPAPNYIPSKPGAVDPSPNGPKPLFANIPAQGGPKAGTDPRPKNAYFGNGYPDAPMVENLPSGPCNNDAFKLPAFGPSAGRFDFQKSICIIRAVYRVRQSQRSYHEPSYRTSELDVPEARSTADAFIARHQPAARRHAAAKCCDGGYESCC